MRPFELPDFYRPWPPRVNPHVEAARAHARTWAAELGLIDAAVWDAATLDSIDLALFAAYCFPDADQESLELITDWYVWGFFFDDWFLEHYKQHGDAEGAEAWIAKARAFMPVDLGDAVPEPEDPVQAALADLWARTAPGTGADWRRRFADETFAQLGDAFWELENLRAGRVPNPIDYLERKRGVSAGRWVATLVEQVDKLHLAPDTVSSRPVQVLRDTFTDAQVLLNDVFSYQREVEVEGEVHNFVLVLRDFLGLTPQDAADTANDLLTSRLLQFESTLLTEVPELAEREQVARLACRLQDINAGSHEWHLRSSRYMNEGTRGADPYVPIWRYPTGLGTSAARLWAGHRPLDHRPYGLRPPEVTLQARTSPHASAARIAAAGWARRMGLPPNPDAVQRTAASLPDAPRERLELVAQWQVLLAELDAHLEGYKSRHDLIGGRAFLDRLPRFLDPAPPEPVNPFERALADLWRRTAFEAREQVAVHFADLVAAREWELANSVRQRVPDAVDYLVVRRGEGTGMLLDLLQFGMALPQDERPTGDLADCFADAATSQRDLAAFHRADHNNGVLAVQRLLECEPPGAAAIVGDLRAARLAQFDRLAPGSPRYAPAMLAWLAGEQNWSRAPRLPAGPTGLGTRGVKAWL
ncbi:germacradienol/geosmin synthase [Nonomuraea sp. NPDC050663]|uniref:terpene synthase family protein n=1 Tax=Nonomuraea sp. NPDC050663 TaxID=3364370 RepID=UPI0037A2C8BE